MTTIRCDKVTVPFGCLRPQFEAGSDVFTLDLGPCRFLAADARPAAQPGCPDGQVRRVRCDRPGESLLTSGSCYADLSSLALGSVLPFRYVSVRRFESGAGSP